MTPTKRKFPFQYTFVLYTTELPLQRNRFPEGSKWLFMHNWYLNSTIAWTNYSYILRSKHILVYGIQDRIYSDVFHLYDI